MIIWKNKVSKDFWGFVIEEAVKSFPTEYKTKVQQNTIKYVELKAVCVGTGNIKDFNTYFKK